MNDWREDRLGAAERGANPLALARLPSGFAVIGDSQFLPGYCLLLASPRVGQLDDLPFARRVAFLRDMSLLGEAVRQVCHPVRMNYEIFGNSDPFLHAHVLPRYAWEKPERLRMPASHYPREQRFAPEHIFTEDTHAGLKQQIALALLNLVSEHSLRVM